MNGLVVLSAMICSASACCGQGTMYAVDSSRAFYTINLTTGAKTSLGSLGAAVGTAASLTFDCATQTVYAASTVLPSSGRGLYTVNLATRLTTRVGLWGDTAITMHGLEIDPRTGNLYGTSLHNNSLYSVNKATGAATVIGQFMPVGATNFPNIAFSTTTNTMYLVNTSNDTFNTLDLATGQQTLIGPLAPVGGGAINCGALAFNTDNNTLYMVDNDSDILYTIDTSTGAATAVGPTGTGNLIGLVYVTSVCPPAPPTCGTSDFNGDGDFGTDSDIEAFFACLAGQCCASCFSGGADFNGDGDTGTDADIEAFFRVLAGGAC